MLMALRSGSWINNPLWVPLGV